MGKLKPVFFFCTFLLCILLASCMETSIQKDEPRYKLFETTNMWTFIQLDTATGRMWQIQYVVDGDNRGAVPLNSQDLTNDGQRIPGRFTLYPTKNMWTFILLDQINGCTWQIQWSQDDGKRGIVGPIFRFR